MIFYIMIKSTEFNKEQFGAEPEEISDRVCSLITKIDNRVYEYNQDERFKNPATVEKTPLRTSYEGPELIGNPYLIQICYERGQGNSTDIISIYYYPNPEFTLQNLLPEMQKITRKELRDIETAIDLNQGLYQIDELAISNNPDDILRLLSSQLEGIARSRQ